MKINLNTINTSDNKNYNKIGIKPAGYKTNALENQFSFKGYESRVEAFKEKGVFGGAWLASWGKERGSRINCKIHAK